MNVRVRLFASAREAAGVGHLLVEVPDGAAVRDAVAAVAKLHPLVAEIRQAVLAKNREYVGLDDPLADGDELAIIPPVSGGAVSSSERILVSPSPLSVDAAIDAVSGPDSGGIVVFLGTVRDASRGRRVRHLEYEAYAEMAEPRLRAIAAEEAERHGLCAVAVEHRIGIVPLGEPSVIVAASAPHRGEAFAGARAVIDRVKAEAPIWKVEVGEDGSARRVEGRLPPVA
jgi:molybdopterin synthase catalytic subunit